MASLIPSGEVSFASPLWESVRFRRAKDKKGWALLGIPRPVYPLVALRLFELQARMISRHETDDFTSLLFEASPNLAAKLACVFPAPPGCDTLKVSETRDRILSGKAANSAKALSQRPDPADLEAEAA
ncbi:hypothetical protein [Leptolyngbya sp. PCC 6406]|uniref:hypothetical protein n=1 Tax=Leptolyngbya sp. PCC 6406 TaxID=1173264 RepID=UPI0002ABBF9A|nr:hypothetical protein [Leptolyngbya sp. PCC 6406]